MPDLSSNPLYPLYREDAVRLLRGSGLNRASSDAGQYSSLERYLTPDPKPDLTPDAEPHLNP